MPRLGAVLFDLDGLLADTEGLHERSWRAVLGAHDIEVTDEEYRAHWIRAGRTIDDLLRDRGLPHDPERLRQEKFAWYLARTDELRAMPGAVELVRGLRGRTPVAIASSSWRNVADAALAKLGVAGCFDVVATFETVPRPKPAPDVFLHAARELGVEPSRCVVLEDAEKGVVAAHAAGMKCVAVPNEHTRDNDFSKATVLVESLVGVTPETLEALVGA
jgi:HAD superfamily hydrolase (TIGR01509 family)